MKKLLLIFAILISLVACSKIKINPIKPVITEGLKTILQTKNDVQMAVVPDGDKELTINGETYIVKGQTFKTIKNYLNANNQLQKTIVDLVGDQITDENIATIAYYADKYSVNAKDLLNSLNKWLYLIFVPKIDIIVVYIYTTNLNFSGLYFGPLAQLDRAHAF